MEQRWKEAREEVPGIYLREDCSRQKQQFNPKALVRSLPWACQGVREEANVAEAPGLKGRVVNGAVGQDTADQSLHPAARTAALP